MEKTTHVIRRTDTGEIIDSRPTCEEAEQAAKAHNQRLQETDRGRKEPPVVAKPLLNG